MVFSVANYQNNSIPVNTKTSIHTSVEQMVPVSMIGTPFVMVYGVFALAVSAIAILTHKIAHDHFKKSTKSEKGVYLCNEKMGASSAFNYPTYMFALEENAKSDFHDSLRQKNPKLLGRLKAEKSRLEKEAGFNKWVYNAKIAALCLIPLFGLLAVMSADENQESGLLKAQKASVDVHIKVLENHAKTLLEDAEKQKLDDVLQADKQRLGLA